MRKESEFWQYYCWNLTKVRERKRKSGREKFLIFGNTITEIPSTHTCCPSVLKMWVHARKTKCGNGIAEIGKKNGNYGNAIAENGRKKKIVVAEITCEELKKKSVTSTIFLQRFHNKSHMISYY